MKKNRWYYRLSGLTAAAICVCGATAAFTPVSAQDEVVVYRLYNRNTGEHFYTSNKTEKNCLAARGWDDEGIGWYGAASGDPVYRVYNPNAPGGDHYYTTSAGERDELVALGWKSDFDGRPVFYSGGTTDLYVAYNPNAQSGAHNYTTAVHEQNVLLESGWQHGAVAWKVSRQGEPAAKLPAEMCTVDGILIVNKKHRLPADYAPGENPEAKQALVRLIAAMQAQGMDVSNSYSGYRSYAYQNQLYQRYCSLYGQAQADTFSARAGYSEHQTGLAFDLMNRQGQLLESRREADWLLAHAADYGFIVRYQQGKDGITGYIPEPWHLRYLGEIARSVVDSSLTLEEYLGVEGGGYR